MASYRKFFGVNQFTVDNQQDIKPRIRPSSYQLFNRIH